MLDRLGVLSETDREAFSRPIDLDDAPDGAGFLHSKGLIILALMDNRADFELHPHIAQFQPAVDIIAQHETNRNTDDILTRVALTIRQNELAKGEVQQNNGYVMHRDDHNPLTKKRFYVVSDKYPTEFYEQLDVPIKRIGYKRLAERPDPSYIPQPYEIVGGSAGILHCSPIMPEQVVRTFMRLTFCYQQ